ncbi:type III restriction enzyme, res subunit [Mycobacterium kansasii 732]|nr:type III restriction enzyme, res subunit [Mycobacterium kansasii 732]
MPTEHLKTQWAQSAARHGLALDPRFTNSNPQTSPEYHGVVVTYAQVAAHPALHRVRTEQRKTLVVFDEIHHGGDAKTWGDAIREAFGDATRRLGLTGTPFRSDDSPIPFVSYAPGGDGVLRSQADHTYGYAEALADGVVRPVVFLAYSGQARWRDSAGEEHEARLGEPLSAEQTARAWRTALDPAGEWMPAVITAADQRLRQLRAQVPDAGGMIIASDRTAGPSLCRVADQADFRSAHRRLVRRSRILVPHRGIRFQHQPVAGRRADGFRRCRRASPVGGDLCHQCLDAVVLRASGWPVRAVTSDR